jgi:hypothetical protein
MKTKRDDKIGETETFMPGFEAGQIRLEVYTGFRVNITFSLTSLSKADE